MRTKTGLWALPIFWMAGAGLGFAQIFTGDPSADALWVSDGLSSSAGNYMLNAGNTSGAFSANVYSTAFALTPDSTLLGPLGITDGWTVGDTIVGVGGVFASTGNGDLTYDNANGTVNLHLVVKYGSPSATWALAGTGASLSLGGTGAVLLGVLQETISPTTGLTTPSDSPLYVNSSAAQVTLPGGGDEGQVLTLWSGNKIVGFESFLDLTVLAADEPAANVQAGDKFVLDLQQGSGALQDSLGVLPSTLQTTPEPSTYLLLLGGLGLLTFYTRRKPKAP
jgi:hypothetical protein